MIGLESWFFNFTQAIWKSQTKESVADIPRPYTEYAIWWTMKCGEMAAFIGGCIVHPAYRFYLIRRLTPETTTNNSRKIIRNTCRRIQGRFLIAGLIAGPIVSLADVYLRGWNERQLKTRCFEIRKNVDALVLDRYATAFFLVGWYWKRFQGGADGVNLALFYYLIYRYILLPYTDPMLKDKLAPTDHYASLEEAAADQDSLRRFWKKQALAAAAATEKKAGEVTGS